MVAVLALLGDRAGIAQTVETASVERPTVPVPLRQTQGARFGAPIGHRQPQARDLPSHNLNDLERLTEEDAAIDRKLTICRGC
jgi:hypothetical protein